MEGACGGPAWGGPAWMRGPRRPRRGRGVSCEVGRQPQSSPPVRSLSTPGVAVAVLCAGAAVPYAVGCGREAWCDAQRRAVCRRVPAYEPDVALVAYSAAAESVSWMDAREHLPGVLKSLALGMNPYDYLRYCEQKLPDPGDVRWRDFLPLYGELVSAAGVRERVRALRRRVPLGGQVKRMEQAFAECNEGTVGVHEVSVLVKTLGLDDLPPAAYAQFTVQLMAHEGRGGRGGLSLDEFRPIHAWLVAQNREAARERRAQQTEAVLRASSAFGVGIITGALRAPGAAAAVLAALATGDRDGAARRMYQWCHGGKSPASSAGVGRLIGGKQARRVAHALRDAYAARGYVWNETGGINVAGVRSRASLPDEYADAVVYCYLASEGERRSETGWFCCVMAASTDPSFVALYRPQDLVGTAVMVPGQYKYAVGVHAGPVPTAREGEGGTFRRTAQYLALVQAAPVRVWRDAHCDDTIDFQHTHKRADDEPFFSLNIGRAEGASCSAGCQVVQDHDVFRQFMRACSSKLDKHVVSEATDWNPGANEYLYTLLDQSELEAAAGAKARARLVAPSGAPAMTALDGLIRLMGS